MPRLVVDDSASKPEDNKSQPKQVYISRDWSLWWDTQFNRQHTSTYKQCLIEE